MTKNLWQDMVVDLRARRAERARRRDLEAQLAVYTTPAEIEEMLAIVERHDNADADLAREILLGHRTTAQRLAAGTRAPVSA